MKSLLLGCLLGGLVTNAWAHRLDEYLQAIRIAVATNRIDISLELTPGAAVADQVLTVIDSDRDGQISGSEVTNYTKRVLGDIKVWLDEKPLTLTVAETSFPSRQEMTVGVGVIRIKAAAPIAQFSAGSHTISLTNAHLPAMSVYLVNTLVTKDPAIKITKQTRDELQKEYRLEFSVTSIH